MDPKNKWLGEIKYDKISENEALLEITVYINDE